MKRRIGNAIRLLIMSAGTCTETYKKTKCTKPNLPLNATKTKTCNEERSSGLGNISQNSIVRNYRDKG